MKYSVSHLVKHPLMKYINIPVLILLTALLSQISCQSSREAPAEKTQAEMDKPMELPERAMDVFSGEELVRLVKADAFIFKFMPLICGDDIQYILDNAEDTSLLYHFPKNPVSSFLPKAVSKGEFLLWTIESWRKTDPAGHIFERYPSAVSMLKDPTQNRVPHNSGEKVLKAISAYRNWWEKYGSTPDQAKMFDPLEGSGVSW